MPIERFDDAGLGQEPNNLAAVSSLTGYRTLRWGRHLDLLITDQHCYRSEEPSGREPAAVFSSDDFPELFPEEAMRSWMPAAPTRAARRTRSASATQSVPNFRKAEPPQTHPRRGAEGLVPGAAARVERHLEGLGQLRWARSTGARTRRTSRPALAKPWPGAGYACFGGGGDYGTAYTERAEIYDAVAKAGITGFVTVSGDRHSFWAGLAAKALPPRAFEPVGAAFITGSVSAPGLVEAFEHRFPKDHPLRALYVADAVGKPHARVNLLLHHGVRSCLEYQRTGDLAAARRASNPDLSPHLSFVDMGGHGYADAARRGGRGRVRVRLHPAAARAQRAAEAGRCAIASPAPRSPLWRKGERPRLEQRVIEGDPETAL